MNFKSFVFILTLTSKSFASGSLVKSWDLFKEISNHFHLKYGIVFYCERLDTKVWSGIVKNELRYLSFFDVSDSSFNINNSFDIMRYDYHQLGILFDTTCSETKEIFEKFSRFSFFNASYIWLMMTNDSESLFDVLGPQNINLDAEITVAFTDNQNVCHLFDVYNPSSRTNGKLIIQSKGTWDIIKGLNISLNGSKFDRRSDLQGIFIHSGLVATALPKHETLQDYMESFENPLNDAQHRHNYRLFKILSEKHNFKLFLRRAPLWGILKNGTYDGVLGMFQKNQIELSISPFRYTPDRFELVDFTVVTWVTTPTIVFRHPQDGMRNIFLQPLSSWVWLTIMGFIFMISIFITVSIRLQYEKKINMTFNRAFVLSVGILSQQGFIETLNKSSTRVVLVTSILFSLITYQYYSSFIVSSLLTDSPKVINTLRQLIDSDLTVGIEDTTYNVDFFETTNDKIALELYKKKIKNEKNFFDADEGLAMMKEGGFAFHVDTSYAYRLVQQKFTEEEICELNEMLLFPIRPLSNLIAKDSPFREFFVIGLQRLIESGIVDYHTKRWSAARPKCVKSNQKIKSVDIGQASVVFIFLAVAILTSLVFMFCEILYFKFVHSRHRVQ